MLGSAEKARATKEIQSAEEGGSTARFSKSFFKVFLLGKIFLGMFWGSFGGLKTYSEQIRFMGQDF